MRTDDGTLVAGGGLGHQRSVPSLRFVSAAQQPDIAAFRGRDRHAAYAATKSALLGLTVNLAAEPAQIAASIVFLAFDSRFSTGSVLYADGSYTAR
jgi:NAD(P)-dependent dehydrogenase (short-subunit alcohol dehydrogenase family)